MDDTAAALSSFANGNTASTPLGLAGHSGIPSSFDGAAQSILSRGHDDNDSGNHVADVPDESVGATEGIDEDVDGIAFAAEVAAQAVEANDAAVSQQQQLEAAMQMQQQTSQLAPDVGPPPHPPMASEALINSTVSSSSVSSVNDPPLICRICKQGESEGRPILRFLPVDHDLHALAAAPGVLTFTQDIQLHVFCGKTASILPTVNAPELEILTKAGLKNKHGIGPEVNAALARTRCAILRQPGAKEKQYYLVREFESHLAAIRHTHVSFATNGGSNASTSVASQPTDSYFQSQHQPQHQPYQPQGILPSPITTAPSMSSQPPQQLRTQQPQQQQHQRPPLQPPYNGTPGNPYEFPQYNADPSVLGQTDIAAPSSYPQAGVYQATTNNNTKTNNSSASRKPLPAKSSSAGKKKPRTSRPANGGGGGGGGTARRKPKKQAVAQAPPGAIVPVIPRSDQKRNSRPQQQQQQQQRRRPSDRMQLTAEGKVQCPCGGTFWPSGTPRGASSYRSHVQTKRHQKWMQNANSLDTLEI